MAVKHFPEFRDDNDFLLGDGYLFLGEADEDFDETKMEQTGCLMGTATFTPTIDMYKLEAGSPLMAIRQENTRIAASLKVTMVEMGLRKLQKILGLGTLETENTTTESVVDEEMIISGRFWHHLQGYNLKTSPVPVVTDDSATPTTFTAGTDYVINSTTGLIKRVTTGSIPDNSKILITYSWDRPALESIKVGSEAHRNVYPLKFIVPMPDGRRWTLIFWKAVPTAIGDINFQADDSTKVDVTFEALADRTRDPDEILYKIEKEIETYYTP